MVEKATSLALSFPFCQLTILHSLVAVSIIEREAVPPLLWFICLLND
jgi:hypothetical protein